MKPVEPLDFPFLGAATLEIRNIVPGDDGHVSLDTSGFKTTM